MELGLWRETIGRCLGSHDEVDIDTAPPTAGRISTTIHPLPCRRTGEASTIHSDIVHRVVTRASKQCHIPTSIEDTTSSRQLQGENNPEVLPHDRRDGDGVLVQEW